MKLIEQTTVPETALPVEEFKAHLRLGSGFAEDSMQDDVLASFLRAALAAIEGQTGKVLFERAFSWSLSQWREDCGQVLPIAPVSAVIAVRSVDRLGVATEVSLDRFWLDDDMAQPRLRPVAARLPSIPQAGQIAIDFIAGYGPAWADIPADLAQAVLLLAAHYYEFRSETALTAGCMPFGVTSLIARYKTMRLYAGGR